MKQLWLIILLLLPTVYAATLHGAVYDAAYASMNDVQLVVNSTPKQNYLAKGGAYFFNLPPGSYTVTVEKYHQRELIFSYNEYIVIDKDGEFQLDIILNDTYDLPPSDDIPKPSFITILRAKYGGLFYSATILLVIALLILLIVIQKRKIGQIFSFGHKEIEHDVPMVYEVEELMHTEEELVDTSQAGDLDNLLAIIKAEGGRITQKDIRKKLPLSEAKVSLMISELEANGRIKKIKKGRGNIVVLNE